MIQEPIYEPKARAKEYGDLAINIYTGCNHGCTYCFARDMAERFTAKNGVCTFDSPEPRRDIVESVRRQLEREQITGKLIHLCFMCDPYPAEIDTAPTREIIQLIKAGGNAVQILTKGGNRAERDFDLLDSGDWFGVTLTGEDSKEPRAALSSERYTTIKTAHARNIQTWISFEPVYNPETVYTCIRNSDVIDLFRIGKLNHYPSGINWVEFGMKCVELCEQYGRNYYIKEDLRKAIWGEGEPIA